jgi:hypothetical protein
LFPSRGSYIASQEIPLGQHPEEDVAVCSLIEMQRRLARSQTRSSGWLVRSGSRGCSTNAYVGYLIGKSDSLCSTILGMI